MKLHFHGTRGEIEARTDAHRRHTSLLVEYRRRRVMIDAGSPETTGRSGRPCAARGVDAAVATDGMTLGLR